MRELVKIFKALSDGTRLRMMKLLQQRELCVYEIKQAMDISQTRASRNLGILKNACLISDRRDGLWVHYSINKDRANEYHGSVGSLLERWLENEQVVLEDRKRLAKAKKLSKRNSCRTG
jgi:ArsR family transcriptional regulator